MAKTKTAAAEEKGIAQVPGTQEAGKTDQSDGPDQGRPPASNDKKRDPTIEQLGESLDPAVYAGVCARKKWRAGKRIPEEVFKGAVKEFLDCPMDGSSPKREEEKEVSE